MADPDPLRVGRRGAVVRRAAIALALVLVACNRYDASEQDRVTALEAEMKECYAKEEKAHGVQPGVLFATGCGWSCSPNETAYAACTSAATIACAGYAK